MKKRELILIFLLAVFFTACKTKQHIAKEEIEKKSLTEELIKKIKKAEPDFVTANINKIAVTVTMNGRTYSIPTSCKIKKDSVIQLSFMPILGFEAVRVEITPDSIRAFEKLNRRMYVADFNYLYEQFGIKADFYSLQALISNQLFTFGTKEIDFDNCNVNNVSRKFNVVEYKTDNIAQITTTNSKYRIEKVEIATNDGGYQLTTLYSEFGELDGIKFPQKITMYNVSGSFNCELLITKALFDKPMVFSSLKQDRYQRADINQLLKKNN